MAQPDEDPEVTAGRILAGGGAKSTTGSSGTKGGAASSSDEDPEVTAGRILAKSGIQSAPPVSTAPPPVSGGILPNVGAGAVEGGGGYFDLLANPSQIITGPLSTIAGYGAQGVARLFGASPDTADRLRATIQNREPSTPPPAAAPTADEVTQARATLANKDASSSDRLEAGSILLRDRATQPDTTGEKVAQNALEFATTPGTYMTDVLGRVMKANPLDVPIGGTGERIARETGRGITGSALMPGGPVRALATGIGSTVGAGELANVAPEWLKPGAELVGNVLGGSVAPGLDIIARGAAARPPTEPPAPYLAGVKPFSGQPSATGPTSKTPMGTGEGGIAANAAEAKGVAQGWYKAAEDAGGTLSPKFTNDFIDNINAKLPQTGKGAAVEGDSAVAALKARLEAHRDTPMTLQEVQEIDQGLSNLIDKEWKPGGVTNDGRQLIEVQRDLRDQVDAASGSDVQGGKEGFDALTNARKAWSQFRKMDDLERMHAIAQDRATPQTSLGVQISNRLSNRAKSRGYSDEERTALEDAGKRGAVGNALRVASSGLVPYFAAPIGAGIGALFGGGAIGSAVGTIAAASAGHALARTARTAENAVMQARINRARDLFSRGIPYGAGVNALAAPPGVLPPYPWTFSTMPDITSQQPNPLNAPR